MYNLFLDDYRIPEKVTWVALPQNVEWIIARNYNEFVYIIAKMGLPGFVAYDCDLCEMHYNAYLSLRGHYVLHYKDFPVKCGISCAEHLISLCDAQHVRHPDFVVHSKNDYAKPYIEDMIELFNRRTNIWKKL